jgi:hypothetical protein
VEKLKKVAPLRCQATEDFFEKGLTEVDRRARVAAGGARWPEIHSAA